jgi:hypothetical protein
MARGTTMAVNKERSAFTQVASSICSRRTISIRHRNRDERT